jgi:CRP-like cAMP-binding protein
MAYTMKKLQTPGNKHTYLQAVDIFQDLNPQEVEEIGHRAPMKQVPAGTRFYSPDQPLEVLFILKLGRIRLYQVTPDGRELTMGILEAGTIFGEMSLVGQALNQNFAEALTPCLLCLMSREDVKQILLSEPRIAIRITEIIGKRLLETETRLLELAYKHAPARVAAQLLRMADNRPGWLGRKSFPEVQCTHEELAALVGVHRETATKILNEFRQEKWVTLKRGKVILLDLPKLEQVSANS